MAGWCRIRARRGRRPAGSPKASPSGAGDHSQLPAPRLALPAHRASGTVTGPGLMAAALPASPCEAGGFFRLANANSLPSCGQVLSQELHSCIPTAGTDRGMLWCLRASSSCAGKSFLIPPPTEMWWYKSLKRCCVLPQIRSRSAGIQGGQAPKLSITLDSPIRINVLYKDLIEQPDSEYLSSFTDFGGDLGCLRLNIYSSARVGSRYSGLPGPGNVFWLSKKSRKSSKEQRSKCQGNPR